MENVVKNPKKAVQSKKISCFYFAIYLDVSVFCVGYNMPPVLADPHEVKCSIFLGKLNILKLFFYLK